MRQWMPGPADRAAHDWLAEPIDRLGEAGFERALLQGARAVVPATTMSVYRVGAQRRPERFFSASCRTPDTTHDCWRAYVSGPWRRDRTLTAPGDGLPLDTPVVCHITAAEVPAEHRAKVYDAHGMRERVSVVRREHGDAVFAVNFYRHDGQRPFSDGEIDDFGRIAPAVLALARKQVALAARAGDGAEPVAAALPHRERLLALCPALTARELDICERLLAGMTQDGIAADLGLGLPTVKTYRNRAFGRLGIHFRNELFARVLNAPAG